MRSHVSLAELFHEIRVSIYESRSRRFLSLGIGRTFIILRERIRIEVENKKRFCSSTSVTFTAPLNESNCIFDKMLDKNFHFLKSSLLSIKFEIDIIYIISTKS